MHSVTTEQNNSHYFKFFKRPRWILMKKVGTYSVIFLKCTSEIFWVCLEKKMGFQITICMGQSHLLMKFCFILVGYFFMPGRPTVRILLHVFLRVGAVTCLVCNFQGLNFKLAIETILCMYHLSKMDFNIFSYVLPN